MHVWIIYGTFKPVSKEFYQLVTLQGHIFDSHIPFIYILTTDKTKETHSKILKYTIETCKSS